MIPISSPFWRITMNEKTRKIIYKVLIVVFSVVFVVSAVVVGHYIVDSIQANQQHSDTWWFRDIPSFPSLWP